MVSPRSLRRFALATSAATASALLVAMAPADAASTYRATITRTEHDIPHIVAEDWGSLGFGSGYAAAETSICTLADTVLAARGQRSKYLGADKKYDDQVAMNGTNLQVDALVTDLHNRQVVEKLLADPQRGPSAKARQMVAGYAEGVNQYLKDIGGTTNVPDERCKGAPYIEPNATELDLWYGVFLANILASTGYLAKEIVNADPPSTSDPGLPATPADAVFAQVPDVPLDLSALPNKLPIGSNATAVGKDATTTGSGMILGNPHFPWRGRYRFTQQHLTIPGEYNVAGGSLIGSPAVNIGWNNNVAWSHTVSTAYRFTPYEYRIVAVPTQYLSADGVLKQVERRTVQFQAKQSDGTLTTITEDLYRTPEGYVVDAPALFMGWTPVSFFAIRDANAEHLRTIDTFLDMGTAASASELLAKQDAQGGMPWVNTIATDRAGNALYADHSVVPNVSNSLASGCMTPIGRVLNQVAGLPGLDGTLAGSACQWGTDADASRPGIFGPANLPKTVRTDWVMNANDSYWLPNPDQKLEGFARIIGCEQCVRTHRSRMVYQYVLDHLKDGKISPEILRGTEHENRVGAAIAMGTNADLKAVCEAADGGDACPVLEAWDRHSNATSKGYALFEAFAVRMPAAPLVGSNSAWNVQFDANDPVNTPRDLNESNGAVVTAMKDGIAAIRAKNLPIDSEWGAYQVAGDDGVDPIPLGGGEGDKAGNANALASRNPDQNKSFAKAVTYGSSHIQSIAFLPDGGVETKTILTYGQSENPARASHQDQTALFGNKEWVDFRWTDAQIAEHKVSSTTVTNAPPPVPTCGGKPATVVGTNGTPGNDVIYASAADDTIYAGGGNDTVCGVGGNDTIYGGTGNDVLYGGSGNDLLGGQDGDDQFAGGIGADRFSGGAGSDRVFYGDHATTVTVTLGNGKADDGNAIDAAGGKRDEVFATVEGVVGSKSADVLTGNSAANHLDGSAGNDRLVGNGGNDLLSGSTGSDTFLGGGGNDYLSAKDNVRDASIDGGTGTDKAIVDSIDPKPISVP